MKKVMMMALVVAGSALLSGCQLEKQYLDDCEANGVSRDVCFEQYHADQRNSSDNYAKYQDRSAKEQHNKEKSRKHHTD
ncbi:MAG: hypothetical protein WAK61_03760 [Leclercia sp.]